MSALVLHVNATIQCPHLGTVTATTTNTRVKVSGQAVVTVDDTFTVAGCTFTVPPSKPQPCVKVQWIVPAKRVRVNGALALLEDSTGICQSADQIPQGPPNVIMTQLRVKGT